MLIAPSQNPRLHSLSSTVVDLPRSQAPSSIERWYVLILTCLIYAINIADRYVVSTVLEPIRLERAQGADIEVQALGHLNIDPLPIHIDRHSSERRNGVHNQQRAKFIGHLAKAVDIGNHAG